MRVAIGVQVAANLSPFSRLIPPTPQGPGADRSPGEIVKAFRSVKRFFGPLSSDRWIASRGGGFRGGLRSRGIDETAM